MNDEEGLIRISPPEERELRRVFDRLCDFHKKQRINKELGIRRERLAALLNQGSGPAASGGKAAAAAAAAAAETAAGKGNGRGAPVLTENQIKQQTSALMEEIDGLEEEIAQLENNPHKKISLIDVAEGIKFLGKKCSKKEVADMVWEVDENLDNCIDWEELRLLFHRNINDKTGLEPAKLFNMAQFMIYDVDNSGAVSVDETMNMLFARHGRVKMESKIRELFGEEMKESGTQGGEINFQQYLAAVERTQLQTFLNSSVGRAQLAKAGHKGGSNRGG